ncbi:hypothetical protein O6H91_10G038800 [Diphasiastrum complanatum]|uniref:Uncharacterized protein n=1 Tax=Diphasiastrum complanatum TaxID=34168 RepID=A0ACC2CG41_DIPCM|nr:hypothetical protein O6H91_10G038800 [Diphasiastrum complanatum]
MSLTCLACHAAESSGRMPDTWRSYSVSSYSDDEGRCGVVMNCWSKKPSMPHATENLSAAGNRQQVVPVPNGNVPSSPRLMRCHAVRRDLFRDWNFEEMAEESRQLCLNISGRA